MQEILVKEKTISGKSNKGDPDGSLNKSNGNIALASDADRERMIQLDYQKRLFGNVLRKRKIIGEDNIQNDLYLRLRGIDVDHLLFRFLAFLIQETVYEHSTDVNLKLVLAFLTRTELKNQFKAVFELMSSEVCDPSV